MKLKKIRSFNVNKVNLNIKYLMIEQNNIKDGC